MKNLIAISSKFIPLFVKKAIGKIVNIPISHNSVFKYYLKKYGQVKILFNNGEKRMGYLTVGYNSKCDIQLEQHKNIRLFFPSGSVSEIVIDRLLESILENSVYEDIIGECSRLLNKKGTLNVSFFDSKQFIKTLVGNKLIQKNWVSKKRYMYSTLISQMNKTYINEDFQIRRFLDLETVKKLLINSGFVVKNTSYCKDSGVCSIYSSKDLSKSILTGVASLLPKNSDIKNDFPVYLFNCDSILILNNFKNINTYKLKNRKFASVIGSLFFLNIIPEIEPSEIFLFDSNQLQVRYLKMFVEIIKISETFEEFLENIFVRDYCTNPSQFLSQKPNKNIYQKIKNLIDDREMFDNTIKKIADAEYTKIYNELPALKIKGNSMCQSITVLDEEIFKPGPAVNVVYTKSNFANNYKMVKNLLLKAKIKHISLEDRKVTDYVKEGGFLYVSNIGEEDWLFDISTESDYQSFVDMAKKAELSNSFRKQWRDSYVGFKKFIEGICGYFWIIDSSGNIFNSQQYLLDRGDSHLWLWVSVKSLIKGKTIEIIHKDKGSWGFKEYLETININKYIGTKNNTNVDTIVFHILLGNGVSREKFLQALIKSSETAKRLVIIEHDRDSINFGKYSPLEIVNLRDLLCLIRSVKNIREGKITVTWSGASKRIDKNNFGTAANCYRNLIITVDL